MGTTKPQCKVRDDDKFRRNARRQLPKTTRGCQ